MTRLSSPDRKKQILEVATEMFARYGFDGVTTRQIADSAGITEAIVFRHFGSKDDLYWEVLSAKCASGDIKQRLEEKLGRDAEPIEIFTAIARDVLNRNFQDPGKSRLLLFSALENHRLSQRFFKMYMSEWYELLASYIRRQMEGGKFRKADPVLAARGFIGMCFHHYLVQELFGGSKYQSYDLDEVAHTMAALWLTGICCEPVANSDSSSITTQAAAEDLGSLSIPKEV
ncbi:MAG TPA: TetR/AcrR family transcriptional regulator [Terriglobales bacterium]|nr:TetR/AcrR family transcriptional regulator [Terriglobales bacterium]